MYPSFILKYILPALLVIVVVGHLATTWRHLDEGQSLAPGAYVVTGSPSIKSQAQPIASGNSGTAVDHSIGGILSGTADEVVDTNPRVDVPQDGTGDGTSHTTPQHPSSAIQSSTSSSQSLHAVTPQRKQSNDGYGAIQPAVIRTGMMSPGSPSQNSAVAQNNDAVTHPGGGGAGNGRGRSPVVTTSPNKKPTPHYPLEYEIYKQQNGASAFNEQISRQTNP
jgi:hypothetical protein